MVAWSGQVSMALERLRKSSVTESMTKYSKKSTVKGRWREQGTQRRVIGIRPQQSNRKQCLLSEVMNEEFFLE